MRWCVLIMMIVARIRDEKCGQNVNLCANIASAALQSPTTWWYTSAPTKVRRSRSRVKFAANISKDRIITANTGKCEINRERERERAPKNRNQMHTGSFYYFSFYCFYATMKFFFLQKTLCIYTKKTFSFCTNFIHYSPSYFLAHFQNWEWVLIYIILLYKTILTGFGFGLTCNLH